MAKFKKPTGEITLNNEHPLARGLTFAYLAREDFTKLNLISGGSLTENGSGLVSSTGEGGTGVSGFDGDTDYLDTTEVTHKSNDFTLVAVARYAGASIVDTDVVLAADEFTNSGGDTNIVAHQWSVTTTDSASLGLSTYNSGWSQVVYTSNSVITDNKPHVHIARVNSSNSVTFFIDGISSGSGTQSYNTTTSTDYMLGRSHNTTVAQSKWNGDIYAYYIFDRALTDNEIQQISENPYLFLKSANDTEFDYRDLAVLHENEYLTYHALPEVNTVAKPSGEVSVNWGHQQAQGLVASFDFIGGQGIERETTGNYNGTLVGTTVSKEREVFVGTGAADNSRLDLGSITSSSPLSMSSAATMITRFYVDPNFGDLEYLRVFDKSDGGSASNGWYLSVNTTTGGTTDSIGVSANGGTDGAAVVIGDTRGKWFDVAVTYDGTALTTYVRDYGSTTDSSASIPTTTTNAAIGNWNHDAATDRQFHGEIEYIHFYDHDLTEAEINNHWQDPYAHLVSGSTGLEPSTSSIASAPIESGPVGHDGSVSAITGHVVATGHTATIYKYKTIQEITANLLITGKTATIDFIHATFQPYVGIRWQSAFGTANPGITIEWFTAETPVSDLAIDIEWVGETENPYIGIEWVYASIGTIGPLEIEWTTTTGSYPAYPAQNETWELMVKLVNPEDGSDVLDISSDLVGEVNITFEENTSGIAEFTVIPNGNYSTNPPNGDTLDILSYMNWRVYVWAKFTSGSAVTPWRLRYGGYIMDADYDPDEKRLYFSATTDLQHFFELMSKDQVNSLLEKYGFKVNSTNPADGTNTPSNWSFWWSENVFHKEVNGWEYMQDLLSTAPVVLYSRKDGTPWINHIDKTDYHTLAVTDSKRFNNSLEITRANRRDLVNFVNINFDYLNYKLRSKVIQYNIDAAVSPCHQFLYAIPLLKKTDVISAVSGLSWDLYGEINFTEHPNNGFYNCYPQYGDLFNLSVVNFYNYGGEVIIRADFKLAKNWVLTSKENYQLRVMSSSSIGANSIAEAEQNNLGYKVFRTDLDFGVESLYDTTYWEDEEVATNLKVGDYEKDTRNGDHEGNQTDLELAQKTAVNHAKMTIKKSHRQNTVDVRIPFYHGDDTYEEGTDIAMRMSITADFMTCTGKVRRYTDYFNIDNGDCHQDVQLALSLHGGVGATETNTAGISAQDTGDYSEDQGGDVYKKPASYKNYEYTNIHLKLGGAESLSHYSAADISCMAGNIDDCEMGWYVNSNRKEGTTDFYYGDSTGYPTSGQNKYFDGLGHNTISYFSRENTHTMFPNQGLLLRTPEITTEETEQSVLGAETEYDTFIRLDSLTLKV